MDKKYVLALLHINTGGENNGISGQTWLQKIMYAASKAHPELECDFAPHIHGMYSQRLKYTLEELETEGLICMEEDDEDGRRPVHLTRRGHVKAEEAIKDVKPSILRSLYSLKSVFSRLAYREMIVLSYTKFPEMKEKSKLVKEYEMWRKDAALSMVKGGKISRSLGAKIYGMGVVEFDDYLDSLV